METKRHSKVKRTFKRLNFIHLANQYHYHIGCHKIFFHVIFFDQHHLKF